MSLPVSDSNRCPCGSDHTLLLSAWRNIQQYRAIARASSDGNHLAGASMALFEFLHTHCPEEFDHYKAALPPDFPGLL